MQTVHKQTLKITEEQVLKIPTGAVMLDCQLQNGAITVWYAFDLAADPKKDEDVTFYVVKSGHDLPDTFPGRYFKTVQQGKLVWHIYFRPLAPIGRDKPIVAERNPNDAGAAEHRDNDGVDNGA